MTSSASARAGALPRSDAGHCEPDRLAHRQVLEQLGALEGPAQPEARPLGRREAVRIVAEDLDTPAAAHEPADRVHERRLARTVRADEPDDFARPDVQIHPFQHEARPERHREPNDSDDRVEIGADLAWRDARSSRKRLARRGRLRNFGRAAREPREQRVAGAVEHLHETAREVQQQDQQPRAARSTARSRHCR